MNLHQRLNSTIKNQHKDDFKVALLCFGTSPIDRIAKWIVKCFFKKPLNVTGPERTFYRVCTSKHLRDLQWISSIAIALYCICIVFILAHHAISILFPEPRPTPPLELSAKLHALVIHIDAGNMIFAGGLTATLGAVLTWAYQTGASRLGTVDLFGCEIGAISRVCLVVDFAQACVEWIKTLEKATSATNKELSPGEKPQPFTSEERYTPVYDDRLGDLQPLDAHVISSITKFYTYRKTMMDYLRKIAVEVNQTERLKCIKEMLYMQFLMYESGRNAIEQLIEYEPDREENRIVIYCSEMVAYHFLKIEYAKAEYQQRGRADFRWERLDLRDTGYRNEIPALYCWTMSQDQFDLWDEAQTTSRELRERFLECFPGATLKCLPPGHKITAA